MKIKNIREPKKFFETLAKCKGSVEFVTDEGDRLNMKSKLSQYIFLTQSALEDSKIGEIELILSEPEDVALILDFLVRG